VVRGLRADIKNTSNCGCTYNTNATKKHLQETCNWSNPLKEDVIGITHTRQMQSGLHLQQAICAHTRLMLLVYRIYDPGCRIITETSGIIQKLCVVIGE
jgi:hypothetical protein